MFPILYQSGEFTLASWHVMFVLGAFSAWALAQFLRSKLLPEISANQWDRLFVILYIVGYFGARLASILIEETPGNALAFANSLFSLGSMTLYGGILAVAVTLIGASHIWRIPFRKLSMLLLAPGFLAIAIGRLGCFLNGDDYGSAINSQMAPPLWSVTIRDLGDQIYRHPVQIYEAIFCLMSAALVLLVQFKAKNRLLSVDLAVVLYTVGRFCSEFFRGDERGQFPYTSLSTSQGISFLVLILWLAYRVSNGKLSSRIHSS